MVWRVVSSWTGTLAIFAAVALWWALQTFPTAGYWFQARTMVVPDVPYPADVVLLVDREIYRPVYGEWVVTVRRYDGEGWTLACRPAVGRSDYNPQALLPDPLTLDWWTEGQCRIDEPGQYFISTTWTFYPRGLPGARRTATLVSNVFTMTKVDGAEQ